MHCDYCQRNNHNTDECRLKHDKERNAALHKSTGQLGQHSKRFKPEYNNTTKVNDDGNVFRVEVNFKLPSKNETHQLLTLIDPCSSGSFINQKHLPEKLQKQISNFIENPNGKSNNFGMKLAHIKVGGAFAQPIDVECVQIKFKVFIGNWYGFHQFYVTDVCKDSEQALLGWDFLKKRKWQVIDNKNIVINEASEPDIISCSTTECVKINNSSEKFVKLKLSGDQTQLENKSVSFTPFDYTTKAIAITNCVNKVENNCIQVCFLNYGDEPIELPANTAFGFIDLSDGIVHVTNNFTKFSESIKYKDAFAWQKQTSVELI